MEQVAAGFAGELARYFETARASWGFTAKSYALSAVRSRMGSTELV
jgi:cyclopropane-fatty-acyl-phospholipid synthase